MMKRLRDMLCDELNKITRKGEITVNSLPTIDQLTHAIKSIDTIIAMSEYGHDDYSYGRRRERYSRDKVEDDLMEHLKSYMHDTDDPNKKQEIRHFMRRLEER